MKVGVIDYGAGNLNFVHSYAFVPEDLVDVLATKDYGATITAAARRDNDLGTQFNPEKRSRASFLAFCVTLSRAIILKME